ncbi:hypothetical protein BRAO285_2770017 [Bradyrhizobium sp. ORS 285]|nr:hypothetical protein BRAO285_2770017 [Bradyrhizobium sp. ORS 285]
MSEATCVAIVRTSVARRIPVYRFILTNFGICVLLPDIPPHSEGALRAIVTTRGAGSDGRDRAAACPQGCADERFGADVKSQRAGTPMLVLRS